MSSPDFTRWNRAGRSRFRYVDGNAVTHLDDLRIELLKHFPQWHMLESSAAPDETTTERIARLTDQYYAPRRDWGWETSRAFARALHVLSEYVDAYANEGYLKTATQWDHVRRLAEMIGYTPKPASSAQTILVLMVTEIVNKPVVGRGFQIKHTPPDGQPPVIFETLEDIATNSALNILHVKNWDFNPNKFKRAFSTLKLGAGKYWRSSKPGALRSGDFAVLVDEGTHGGTQGLSMQPVRVRETAKKSTQFSIAVLAEAGSVSKKDSTEFVTDKNIPVVGDSHLLAAPQNIEKPLLHGKNVIWVGGKHGRNAGDVIAWQEGDNGLTRFANIVESDGQSLALEAADGIELPTTGTALIAARKITFSQFQSHSKNWRIPLAEDMHRSDAFSITFTSGGTSKINVGFPIDKNFDDPEINDVDGNKIFAGYSEIHKNLLSGAKTVWFADPGKDKKFADRLDSPQNNELVFEGTSPKIKSGDPVLLSGGKIFEVAQIKEIIQGKGEYRMLLAEAPKMNRVRELYCNFEFDISPVDRFYDPTPMSNNVMDIDTNVSANPLLGIGRKLVLSSRSGKIEPVATRIVAMDRKSGHFTLDADPMLVGNFKRGDLDIHGNAVLAGHGETKPVKVLGSGNAAAISQEFLLDHDDISHVTDLSLPGGMRADLNIEIERETYRQVASFRDSKPGDAHFVVKATNIGALLIRFGDGRNGRRLPTGRDNILLGYRRGAGLLGNLTINSLGSIVSPHVAVESVQQVSVAAGGDARERLEQIRINAPGRLKAMDRAISTMDFENLAAGFVGIWHAAAFQLTPTGREKDGVNVVLVPAGGGALGSLGDTVLSYLRANGLPGLAIDLTPYEDFPVSVDIIIRVNSTQFDPVETKDAVFEAVNSALDLKDRRPGQTLYRSALVHTVENVVGVANSDVRLFPDVIENKQPYWRRASFGDDGGIWMVRPQNYQVLHSADPALISISVEEAAG